MKRLSAYLERKSNQETEQRVFYTHTVKILAAYFRKLGVTDLSDVEDLLQETYAQAFQGWHTLRDKEGALSWLLTIGYRQFCRYVRVRRAQHLGHSWEVLEEAGEGELLPHTMQAEEQFDRTALCHQVVNAMLEIKDEKKREVMQLYFLAEESLPEIHQKTGVNVSTITTWLSRFRQQMEKKSEVELRMSVAADQHLQLAGARK